MYSNETTEHRSQKSGGWRINNFYFNLWYLHCIIFPLQLEMLLFVDVMGESLLLYLSEQIIIFQSQGGSFYQSIRGESCQMLTNKRPRKMLPPIRSRKRRQLTNERTGQSEQTIISGQQRARTHGTRGHQHWRRSICWRDTNKMGNQFYQLISEVRLSNC